MNAAYLTGARSAVWWGIAHALGRAGWTVGVISSPQTTITETEAEPVDVIVHTTSARAELRHAGTTRRLADAMFYAAARAHHAAATGYAPLLAPGGLVVTVVPMYVGRANADDNAVTPGADDGLLAAAVGVPVFPGLIRTPSGLSIAAHYDPRTLDAPDAVGRIVAALAADPDAMTLSGRSHTIGELANRYPIEIQ